MKLWLQKLESLVNFKFQQFQQEYKIIMRI